MASPWALMSFINRNTQMAKKAMVYAVPPGIVIVAADSIIHKGNYYCDGQADDVEINKAIQNMG